MTSRFLSVSLIPARPSSKQAANFLGKFVSGKTFLYFLKVFFSNVDPTIEQIINIKIIS